MENNDYLDLINIAIKENKINKTAANELKKWLTDSQFVKYQEELKKAISENKWDVLMDSFYTMVIFGTGGIRGVMGAGINRINDYTIGLASQSLANYLLKYKKDYANKGIVIAYDTRNNSKDFAELTASVLAANKIPVFIFSYYRPTPELSFAVRELKAIGGIIVTASHNPPQFNGYKVYREDGVQVLPDEGLKIEQEFKNIKEIKKIDFKEGIKKGIIKYISEEIDKKFLEQAKKISLFPKRNIKIVYSPLHGVGSQSVLPVLEAVGFKNIELVKEQMSIDGNFPTVPNYFPQPEFPIVYNKAIEVAKRTKADLILLSDPDADRLGMAIPDDNGGWLPLNGNQGAVLMLYFILKTLKEKGKLPPQSVVMKTSVTTELYRDIAEGYGVEVIGDLLVGFKFIGDRIEKLPSDKTFIFAAEESIGYLYGNSYRDKGSENAAVIASEMIAYCKNIATTPLKLLNNIYEQYGYYSERLYYELIEGIGAFDQMTEAMKIIRKKLPIEISGEKVIKVIDRLTGEVVDPATGKVLEIRNWDKGDMLTFVFSSDERTVIHLRPSGTEPKVKYYTNVKGNLEKISKQEIDIRAKKLEKGIVSIFSKIVKEINIDVWNK
ncbi:MAG: phospho-sugar mutase [Minisyncoccia bacterium]